MQKIAVFSLNSAKPQMLTAIFKDGALVVSEVKLLPQSAIEQKKKVPGAIATLRANHFKVLVDETTPTVTRGTGASLVTLRTKYADGRAAIIVGLERYRELKQQRLLSLPEGKGNAFEIPDSIVDIEYNGNGEEVYRVNWADIRPEQILMILCSYATVYHNVASADYIAQMEGNAPETTAPGMMASFVSILGYERETAAAAVPESLAGKRLDDDTVVL